mgnify:CR=1 FL=1
MINLEDVLILKKGGIHIKKKNRGKFTEYCGGKVTAKCIARGKRSKKSAFAAVKAGDVDGDGKITVSELAAYSRGATQRAISSFLQQNGTSEFSGHPSQFPSWQIARGDEDLVIFER